MTNRIIYSRRVIAAIFAVLVTAALSFHAYVYYHLDVQTHHMSDRGFLSARMAVLSQIENEFGVILNEAERLVSDEPGADAGKVQMALDLFWSRISSGDSDQNFQIYLQQGVDVSIVADLKKALPQLEAAVANLQRGVPASMEPLTRFRKKYAERISDFTKASFAARIKRFSAAAAEQWGLFQDLRRFQIAFLIYGAALLALLMAAQMWASRAVGRLQARNIENQNLVDKDQLTGLFNRRSFEQELSKHSAKTGNAPKLIAIDIDRFRSVNELVGTAMGDRLLIQIGQRIREAAPGCVVGRMGPDEFLILAQGSPAYIDAIIENVIVGAGAPVDFGDRMYTPSLSIVCVDVALDGASENPIKAVNTAMLEAKRQGGGKVVRFETAMMNDVRDRNLMESDLPGAIHARALEIVAQPKILLADESICGFETLVRWNHPKLGWVSPEKFCTLADSIGLSSSLGLAVADMAFGLASTLKFEFGRDRRMSINVSPAFGSHPDFVPNIKSLLAKHHLSPSDVEFEVTEEALASELGPILDNMSQLRALGCAIAIDDFGKGHSNIGRLTSLPVTVLKLDKSLVQGAADALPSRGIMRGLVQLARELNVELLVEGVETEAQAQLLRELGVTRVQGYFYARPMSPLKLLSWLRQRDSERQGPRMAKAVA